MTDGGRSTRSIRKDVTSPALRLHLSAEISTVVSTGQTPAPATQHVHVRQGRSARTASPQQHPPQQDPPQQDPPQQKEQS